MDLGSMLGEQAAELREVGRRNDQPEQRKVIYVTGEAARQMQNKPVRPEGRGRGWKRHQRLTRVAQ